MKGVICGAFQPPCSAHDICGVKRKQRVASVTVTVLAGIIVRLASAEKTGMVTNREHVVSVIFSES